MHATLTSVISLLFGHWIGDFLLQWDSLAKQKRTSVYWLGLHVLIYSVVILGFALYLMPFKVALLFGSANAVLHFFTDLVTRRFAARFSATPRKLFMIIGFDQLIHTATLISLLEYFWPR